MFGWFKSSKKPDSVVNVTTQQVIDLIVSLLSDKELKSLEVKFKDRVYGYRTIIDRHCLRAYPKLSLADSEWWIRHRIKTHRAMIMSDSYHLKWQFTKRLLSDLFVFRR